MSEPEALVLVVEDEPHQTSELKAATTSRQLHVHINSAFRSF